MTPERIDQDMAVAAAAMLPPTVDQELRTRYRQLSAMLHNAGLAATYAYVAARSNTRQSDGDGALPAAYRLVADGIKRRLARLELLDGDANATSHRDVLKRLGEADAVAYARASAEITLLTGWLSRLADAVYRPETNGSEPS